MIHQLSSVRGCWKGKLNDRRRIYNICFFLLNNDVLKSKLNVAMVFTIRDDNL